MRDVAEYVKCSKQVMSEPMCLDPQRSQPLRERLTILWTRICERVTKGGVYARHHLQFLIVTCIHAWAAFGGCATTGPGPQ